MDMALFDTIVAPITGAQSAPVAVIRVSGPDAWRTVALVFTPWPRTPKTHHAVYGTFSTGDDGLALPFAEGHGYTGEDAVELSIHGSRASVQGLVQACVDAGARLATPGEFTQRAFLNGRMDLTQAEGVRDTIEAETAAQLRLANELRGGALKEEVTELRDRLIGLLAAVEASVDFSEEIGDLDVESSLKIITSAKDRLGALLGGARAGRILRNGYRIAILGRPNAGKSSLLNALLGSERAIVTASPGTTRDTIEESLDFEGVKVVLTDTAGLRDGGDEAESLGIERSREAAAKADAVWYVFDASQGWTDDDEAATIALDRIIRLANKIDLCEDRSSIKGFLISAKTGEGLDRLVRQTALEAQEAPPGIPLILPRHEPLVQRALDALMACRRTLDSNRPVDLLAVDLRDAIAALGEITGETATDDMIARIFRDFCIGK